MATPSIENGPPTRLAGRRLTLGRVLYAAAFVFLLALFTARLPAQLQGGTAVAVAGMSAEAYRRYVTALDVILVLSFCIPALIIFWRRSDDWLAILVSLMLVLFAVVIGGNTLETTGPTERPALHWNLIGAIYKIGSLAMLYLFPNGRFVPRWTRRLVPVGVAWSLLWQLPAPYNPWSWPLLLGNLLDMALYATGLYAQLYRYRRVSTPQERQQTKWVVLGFAVAVLGLYAYLVPLARIPALQSGTARYRFQLVGQPLSYLALLSVPISLTISMLRYRLYDIDIILNRTLVYVPLTAIVAGIIAAGITLSQKLFITLTDQQSLAATVLTTLCVVSVFTPIKDRLQRLVDRYFKEVPDPAGQLRRFSGRLGSRLFAVEVEPLARSLLEEAVTAFGASGGAVYMVHTGDARPFQATRLWDGRTALSVPLQSAAGRPELGRVALGARRSGADYTGRDRALLLAAARAVAQAIEQDGAPGALDTYNWIDQGDRSC